MSESQAGQPAVEWPAPNGYQTLYWDHVHFPRPLSPLGIDFLRYWMTWGGGRRYIVNGYVFRPHRSFGGFSLGDYRISPFYDIPDPTAIWEEETLPHIRELCARVREYDYESLDAASLVERLPSLFSACGDAFRLTMNPFSAFNARTARLLSYIEDDLGEQAPLQVVTMLQGLNNASADSGAGLSHLAEIASREPRVAEALREGRFDALEELPEAAAFNRALAAYLDEYGWRAPTWGELHVATWAEAPRYPLELVRRYLADPEHSPARAIERSRRQRLEAVQETESRLPREKLSHFRTLLTEAEAHVPISEVRAMWQLITCGIGRIPCLQVGNKLAAAGLLADADDVFYLRLDELAQIAAGAAQGLAEQVAERRANLRLWGSVLPPFYLGDAPAWRVRDWYAEPGQESRVIMGVGASKGVVSGRARVLTSLDQQDRLQPGDILVCPSTAPPWTPLFAFVAAVVTDSGGILSHSAIAAREYGIPAVVGTNIGSQRIPDGATITVDGARGSVRIE